MRSTISSVAARDDGSNFGSATAGRPTDLAAEVRAGTDLKGAPIFSRRVESPATVRSQHSVLAVFGDDVACFFEARGATVTPEGNERLGIGGVF
jgi:hypothetical protein